MTLLASTLIHLRRAAVPTSPLAASQTTLFRFPTTARCYSATPNLFSEIGLNKKKLAMEISETHDLNKSQAQKVVNTVFDSIVEAVGDGQLVKIANFGTFQSYATKATKKINPQTKVMMDIPVKNRIRFKAYKSFKEIVEGTKSS